MVEGTAFKQKLFHFQHVQFCSILGEAVARFSTTGQQLVCCTQQYVKKVQVIIEVAVVRVKFCFVIFNFHCYGSLLEYFVNATPVPVSV